MTEVRELESAPRMRTLYPKAGLGAARGLLGRLPGVGGGEPALPDVQLRLPGVEIDREHLADYDRVCGFRLRDVLPPTYPHILAFPLSMQIMTGSDFPFAVVGLVHVRNRIEQVRPIDAGEALDIRVWTEDLRPHDKGMQFEIRAEVTSGTQVVWKSWSTYLRRGGGGNGSSGSKDRSEERREPPRPQAQWKLPGDTGRSYAGVSGDSNPIHMHPLSARLFGMPRPIAHGMYMKARSLAALEGHIGDELSIDVSFKLPVFLPGTVSFASWPEGGGEAGASGSGRGFALHDAKNEKPHLTGSARPA
jgi:acyl dehydratase